MTKSAEPPSDVVYEVFACLFFTEITKVTGFVFVVVVFGQYPENMVTV